MFPQKYRTLRTLPIIIAWGNCRCKAKFAPQMKIHKKRREGRSPPARLLIEPPPWPCRPIKNLHKNAGGSPPLGFTAPNVQDPPKRAGRSANHRASGASRFRNVGFNRAGHVVRTRQGCSIFRFSPKGCLRRVPFSRARERNQRARIGAAAPMYPNGEPYTKRGQTPFPARGAFDADAPICAAAGV